MQVNATPWHAYLAPQKGCTQLLNPRDCIPSQGRPLKKENEEQIGQAEEDWRTQAKEAKASCILRDLTQRERKVLCKTRQTERKVSPSYPQSAFMFNAILCSTAKKKKSGMLSLRSKSAFSEHEVPSYKRCQNHCAESSPHTTLPQSWLMAQHTIKSALACTFVESKGRERVEGHRERGVLGGGGSRRADVFCMVVTDCMFASTTGHHCLLGEEKRKCIRLKADA